MAVPRRRDALTKAADAERHPAAPSPSAAVPTTSPPALHPGPERLDLASRPATTMFSVRLPAELRTRVKLAAIVAGLTVEQWTADALTKAVEAGD